MAEQLATSAKARKEREHHVGEKRHAIKKSVGSVRRRREPPKHGTLGRPVGAPMRG